MRSILTLLIVAGTTIVMAQTRTVVCGHIINPIGNKIKLSYWDGEMHNQTTALDKNGRFKIVTNLNKPFPHDIEQGEERTHVFLYPGDSLFITLDTKKFDETVVYSGKGAVVNNYLAKQYLHFEDNLESPEFQQQYYSKIAFSEATVFAAYADSVANVKLKYLNTHKETLSQEFYDYQYAEIVFSSAKDKADYPTLHFYVQGIKDSVVKVDESYTKFYDQYSLNNEHYLASNAFVYFLTYYVNHKTKKEKGKDIVSPMDQIVTARKVFKGIIREKAIETIVLSAFANGTPDIVRKMYEIAQSEIRNKEGISTIESRYNSVSALFPGNPAPTFTLKTKEGKIVSLEDFKGKIVYLDFWASWCAPCMMEMPSAKKLQDTFATKDVVFLYVSVDESEEDWLKAMAAKNMKGVHVRVKGFDDSLPKKYAVQGIPSYFLIDRKGLFMNNNPPRPSNESIYQVIQDALSK